MDAEDECVVVSLVSSRSWVRIADEFRDNRITMHNASWDYEGSEPRHGTRVTSLAEKPFFIADAPTRREALGLADG